MVEDSNNPPIMAMSDAPDHYTMQNQNSFATIPTTLVKKYGLNERQNFVVVEQEDPSGLIHRNYVTFDHQ